MLSPVSPVSALSTALEKPAVATAETSGVQTAATPLAVLSSAMNASVEGKLNLLLVAARERMFNSLMSAINDASLALNVSRQPDESNAALAQRLADTIRSLPPQQLAVAQKLLDTQAKLPIPLPLIAEALANPDGPEAVQIAVSLEGALTQEPDAVLKAVVNSYEQNAGQTETVGPQEPVPTQSAPVPTAATMAPSAVAAQAPGETPTTPAQGQAVLAPAAALDPDVVSNLETALAPQTTPNQQSAPIAQALGALLVDANVREIVHPQNVIPARENSLPAGAGSRAVPAETKLPTEIALIRSPVTPPPVPRDLQQIRADIKEGLQVVIRSPIEVAGSELLQIIENSTTLVERVVAQALAANAADQGEVQLLPQTPNDEAVRNLAAVMASQNFVPPEETSNASTAAAALLGKSSTTTLAAPATNTPEAAEQMGMPVPLQGIPFAIAQYLPAALPVNEEELEQVDRVDPTDDEEHEQGQDGEAARDESEDESQSTEAHQPTAETPDAADTQAASSNHAVAAPKPLALPTPAPRDPLHDHAFDFYRRMAGWE
ncbi:hypothetical protein PY650_33120 [Rhizobium calliandrae]|uniref:Flagellar hook-length control protein FliK n=1 Tax=Rhizobium calliandrae TaxID=1312182 RepID=A0ABT7KQZ5_9HYPH|nr:hypothetical protein [Rhizobium calliandrae]MDL2410358.1 hypothetical protein [Rhizobium calliandrae]